MAGLVLDPRAAVCLGALDYGFTNVENLTPYGVLRTFDCLDSRREQAGPPSSEPIVEKPCNGQTSCRQVVPPWLGNCIFGHAIPQRVSAGHGLHQTSLHHVTA